MVLWLLLPMASMWKHPGGPSFYWYFCSLFSVLILIFDVSLLIAKLLRYTLERLVLIMEICICIWFICILMDLSHRYSFHSLNTITYRYHNI
jgi:hypothetical protein